MIHCKSLLAAKCDITIDKALLNIQSGKYKSLYKAEKVLKLSKSSVMHCVNRHLSCSQACQQQQKLSLSQKNILLKWIKELTISNYLSEHQLLKKIAEKLCTKWTYNLDDVSLSSLELSSQYTLNWD